jgi:hypothetical protein
MIRTASRHKLVSALFIATLVGVALGAYLGPLGARARTESEAFSGPVLGAQSPSTEQSAALADGVVTEEEVRAALDRAADCLDAHGIQAVRVGDPQLEGNYQLARFIPDGQDPSVGSDVMAACAEEHSAYVTSKYQVQLEEAGLAHPPKPR